MIKAVAKYWGDGVDTYGMPVPYNSYFIVVSPWQNSGAIATIVTLSGIAPTQQNFVVMQGSEAAALSKATEVLDGMHPGLTKRIDQD